MALTDNTRGALLMIASMTGYTVNDAFLKAVSDELPLFQAIFLRGIGTVILLGIMGRALGGLRWPALGRDRWLLVWRSLGEIASGFFFLTALFHMPLANVSAIMQALPLAVTMAGALLFREAVGWRRWTAIGVGFMGVMLIVRPGTEGFTIYSVSALLAVVFVTLRDLAAKGMSRSMPSLTVAFGAAVAVTVFFGVGTALDEWRPVSQKAALQLAGSSLFIVGGYYFSVATMRVGEIGAVAPFRYTSLVVALILGYLVFGDWPAPLTLLGAAIVIGTGLFTLHRERQVQRARRIDAARAAAGDAARRV